MPAETTKVKPADVYVIHLHRDAYDQEKHLCIGRPRVRSGHVSARCRRLYGTKLLGDCVERSWPTRMVSFQQWSPSKPLPLGVEFLDHEAAQ